MSIDLSQFHQVFFEESFEGLDMMESALLELKPDDVDAEVINTIFRAAHSIKGGSATFGFSVIADFTHVLETLLDQVREGERSIDQNVVDLLLQSVDCLRALLAALQNKESEIDSSTADSLRHEFEAILGSDAAPSAGQDAGDGREAEPAVGWQINFKPARDVLQTGNEPLRMFRELKRLGQLEIEADFSALPKFSSLGPEECYLAWKIVLRSEDGKSAIERKTVDEVFEWVVDDADLTYTAIYASDQEEANNGEEVAGQGGESSDSTVQGEQEATANSANAIAKGQDAPTAATKGDASSIRVAIDKIDNLINMVGELVITQSMLSQLGEDFDINDISKLQAGLGQLEHNTRELQESVMRIRMIPISFTFSRFPRMVRDMCRRLDKKIDLKMVGEQTELDKTVMEKIGDPLVHLVRNSLDHGIETPEVRLDLGKAETGTIELKAFHQGGNIIIQIKDDGAGLNKAKIVKKAREKGLISSADRLNDEQIHDLIFQPGFSTADFVSDVSGRGVGMDVVRRNIAELNGSVVVESQEGVGSTFTISLPLTLAILDGQLVRIGQQTYIFPLISIIESLQVDINDVNCVAGGCDVLRLRADYVPIIRMYEIFNIKPESTELDKSLLVVVEGDGQKIGLLVDELQAQQQVVIKSLETNYEKVEGISGATILGDGTVALILDISGIIRMAGIQGISAYTHQQSDKVKAA